MNRRRAFFVSLLLFSVANAGLVAADFTARLDSIDAIDTVKQRIGSTLDATSLRDRRLTLTVRFENPTALDLRLVGGRLRVHTETNPRIAEGAATGFEPLVLPARGATTATFVVQIAPDRVSTLETALETGATGTLRVGVRLRDTRFTLLRTYRLNRTTTDGGATLRDPGGG